MTAIPGATSSTYVPVTADIGQNITCTVTASNTAGSASATATGVGPIAATLTASVITGTTTVGQTLTSTGDRLYRLPGRIRATRTAGVGQANEAMIHALKAG